jgi:DNA-binding transcriptional LysR family regulator
MNAKASPPPAAAPGRRLTVEIDLAEVPAARLENLKGYLAGVGATVLRWGEGPQVVADDSPPAATTGPDGSLPSRWPVDPLVDPPIDPSEWTPQLEIRATARTGGALPGLFGRRGVEIVNVSAEPIAHLVVAGLGAAFIGVTLMGSSIPRLDPGQAVPFLFDRPPARSGDLVFRISGQRPTGRLFAVDLTLRRGQEASTRPLEA